jgi:hypothetical protein
MGSGCGNLWPRTRDHRNLLWLLVNVIGVKLGKYGGKILARIAVASLQNPFGTKTSNRKPAGERRSRKDGPGCLSARKDEPRDIDHPQRHHNGAQSCYRIMLSIIMAKSRGLDNILVLIEVLVKSHMNTMLSTTMAESRS